LWSRVTLLLSSDEHKTNQRRKMARAPALRCCASLPNLELATCRQHRKMARWAGVIAQMAVKLEPKRTLQLLGGSPCPCWNSTKPSSQHSSPPASSRNLRCSRTALMTSRNHLPGWGSLFRAPCSTTLSSGLTSPPASSRIRRRNCTDLQASLASQAQLVARSASVEARWASAGVRASELLWGGTPCDEYGSTTPSCRPSTCSLGRLRS